MDDTVVIGTKDFQVPKYFNFADVIDEWAQKEKVTVFYQYVLSNVLVYLFVCLFFFSNVAQIILVFLIVVNNTSSEPAWETRVRLQPLPLVSSSEIPHSFGNFELSRKSHRYTVLKL